MIILNLFMPQKLIVIKKNKEDVYRCMSVEPCRICLPIPPPQRTSHPGTEAEFRSRSMTF